MLEVPNALGLVLTDPVGSGFLCLGECLMSESMRAAVVAIDGDADRGAYRVLVSGRRWNGWAVPYFARAEVERLAVDSAALEGSSVVRWAAPGSDVLLVRDGEAGADDAVWVTAERVEVDGVTLWNVGDGWVWDEVDALEGDDDDAAAVEL